MIEHHTRIRPLVFGALSFAAAALLVGGCGSFGTTQHTCMADAECPAGDKCVSGECTVVDATCKVDADCEDQYDCKSDQCVLRVDSGVVPETEDDPNVYTCACTCSGPGAGSDHRIVLHACMPDELNPNKDHAIPADVALQGDCSGRVETTVEAMSRTCMNKNIDCDCDAIVDGKPPTRYFRDECNGPCTGVELADGCTNWDPLAGVKLANHAPDTAPVCLAQGTDPPAPIPDPLAAFLHGRNSLCDVGGKATVDIDGESEEPGVNGQVNLWGDPCPGATCNVSVAYQTNIGAMEFGGFLGLGETTLDQLTAGGASLPAVVSLGANGMGVVPIAQMRSSGRGRADEDDDEVQAMWAQNGSPLHVEVGWAAKTCALDGAVIGGVGDDSELSLAVDLTGVLVNQPPTAAAGPNQVLECESTTGTKVVLDSSASSDPDGNIVMHQWRLDSRGGEELGEALAKVEATQVLGTRAYHVKIVDAGFQADEDTVEVKVQDTTPPEVKCNAPASNTIVPSDVPIGFTATAEDTCSGTRPVTISAFKCYTLTKGGKYIDKGSSCVVGVDGDTLTIYNSGGVGTRIVWWAVAEDGVALSTEVECHVDVVKKK